MKSIITLLLSMASCFALKVNAQEKETLESRRSAMARETDPEKNVASMYRIIRDFKLDTIKNAEDIDVMKGEIALSYLHVGAFPKFETFVRLIRNKFNQTSFMNMGADMLFKSGAHRDYTETLARKTVELYDAYKGDSLARPADFPVEDWNRFMRMAAFPYYESYARILHANGKDKTAFFYEEKALKDLEIEELDQTSIALYTTLLESAGQENKAYDILLKMAKQGKISLNMNRQLKRLCAKNVGSEAQAAVFLDSIQRNINSLYKTEVANKMIVGEEAPDFRLLDMNGKQVTLSALKGKIVVLDFWATWCFPCVSSMPAMKQLSSLHPEVVFLFVATGEKGTDAEAKARVVAFIKKNKFPVNVLMDNSTGKGRKIRPVAVSYKVTGIPAKVVIDRHGKLRFLASGYSTDTELINEMEAMIAIAKEQ